MGSHRCTQHEVIQFKHIEHIQKRSNSICFFEVDVLSHKLKQRCQVVHSIQKQRMAAPVGRLKARDEGLKLGSGGLDGVASERCHMVPNWKHFLVSDTVLYVLYDLHWLTLYELFLLSLLWLATCHFFFAGAHSHSQVRFAKPPKVANMQTRPWASSAWRF